MNEPEIKELYSLFDGLEHLKYCAEIAKEEYNKTIAGIKNIEEKICKNNNYAVLWFEILRLALKDTTIDFKKKDLYADLNKILSADFGIDVNNSIIDTKDIVLIQQSINEVKNNSNNNKHYDFEILDKIYNSINSLNFLDYETIKGIISENRKDFNVLNLVKGKFAEYKFIDYLNNKKKMFFYIDNNKNSISNILRNNKGKRPDIILMLDNIFRVFVDVKNYTISNVDEFGINRKEIESFINLEEQLSIPVFLAISNGECKFKTWYFMSVKNLYKNQEKYLKKSNKKNEEYYSVNIAADILYEFNINEEFNDKVLIKQNTEIINIIKIMTDKYINS